MLINDVQFPEYEEFHTRVVFYRIPKNAGTSICAHLTYANLLNFYKRDLREKVKDPTYLKPDEFKDFLLGLNLRNYFSFCVVRNPWERVVSAYFSSNQEDSFDDFCNKGANNYFNIGQQIDWTVGKYPPQKILRFENLQEEFTQMIKDHGLITISPILPHENKTEHNHYSQYYTRKTRDLIYDFFKEDIDMFGYSFEDQKPNLEKEEGSIRI